DEGETDEEDERDEGSSPRHTHGAPDGMLPVTVDLQANTFTVSIPKALLVYEAEKGDAIVPDAGTALSPIRLRSDAFYPAPLRDRMPDEGAFDDVLVLTEKARNGRLALLPGWTTAEAWLYDGELLHGGPLFAVTTGARTHIPVVVENRDALDDRVVLRVESKGLVDARPVTIDVPAGESAFLDLAIEGTGALKHRETGELTIVATGARGEEGLLRVPIEAAAGPSVGSTTLFLHSAKWSSEHPVLGVLADTFGDRYGWVNALAKDPTADDGEIPLAGWLSGEVGGSGTSFDFGGRETHFPLDTALPSGLRFTDDGKVRATVNLRAEQAATGDVVFAIYQGGLSIAEARETVDLPAGQPTALALELAPKRTVNPLKEPGDRLWVLVGFDTGEEAQGLEFDTGQVFKVYLVAAGTKIELPLAPWGAAEAATAFNDPRVTEEDEDEEEDDDESSRDSLLGSLRLGGSGGRRSAASDGAHAEGHEEKTLPAPGPIVVLALAFALALALARRRPD
ncbi:MAG: hypothetical protein ACT4PT_12275, partial [Methanobacteriota archaeon]